MLRPVDEEKDNSLASQFRDSMFTNYQQTLTKQIIEKTAVDNKEYLGSMLKDNTKQSTETKKPEPKKTEPKSARPEVKAPKPEPKIAKK